MAAGGSGKRSPEPVPEDPPRVLVVDADRAYREAAAECALRAGCEAGMVATVDEAVQRLAGGAFRLVVWGPCGNQERLAHELARLHAAARCPLILLDAGFRRAREAYDAGASQVQPKPFVPGALVGAIGAALRSASAPSLLDAAPRIDVRGAVFDFQARVIRKGDLRVRFSRADWALVACLLTSPNRWIELAVLEVEAGRDGAAGGDGTRTADVRGRLRRLRRRLDRASLPCRLESDGDRAYRLVFEALSPERGGF